jgi:acetoacetate decarboxylase
MSVKGKLTKEMMGPNLPLDMPATNTAANFFKDVRILQFMYMTDPEVAANVIPSQFSLDDEVMATLSILDYGFTMSGSYKEAILGVNVLYEGIPYSYNVQLMLNSALPTMGGREVGIPKKVGYVDITQHEDTLAGFVERPKGERLVTGILRIDQAIESFPEEMPIQSIVVRPVLYFDKPAQMDLLRVDSVFRPKRVHTATGMLTYTGISVVDPWHTIPVKKMVGCSYLECDFAFCGGKTLGTL